jgi:2-keto-3-deoxy-L-rhamnonate aldolase RhmA
LTAEPLALRIAGWEQTGRRLTMTDAIARVAAATAKHGKSLGRLTPTVQQGIELNRQGFDFICYSGDVWVLHDALAEAIAKLREGGSPSEKEEAKSEKKS